MLKLLSKRTTGILFTAILPFSLDQNDIVSKDTKTAKQIIESAKDLPDSGKDRLYYMFSIDEFGAISNELNSIYQAGFMGFLVGACYGGFIKSRRAYLNFMSTNEATAFNDHLHAKKKLQDQVTINFAKGAFRWGWRLALFTSTYVGIITTISVYRGKSSVLEYIAAGAVTGTFYKLNLGLRGMAAGGIIGGALGGTAGLLSILVLKTTGTTMEEVRFWQYKFLLNRQNMIRESEKLQSENRDEYLENRNVKVDSTIKILDNLEIKTENTSQTKV